MLRRWKSTFKRESSRLHLLFAGRTVSQKRMLWLAPLLLGLTFVAVTDPGVPALGQAVGKKIIAALKDPLALLGQRSPGKRSGTRHLTKTKTGPHERVLSTVRERPAAANPLLEAPPVVLDIPAGALAPAPTPLPTVETGPGVFNPPFFTPFFPIDFPGPGGPSTPTPPGSTPPGQPPVGPPPPGQPPGSPSPPGSSPPTPPGSPPLTPPGPPIPIPEPATWTMMGLGFLAAVSARRRARKQRAQSR